jgi:hypothetical protein
VTDQQPVLEPLEPSTSTPVVAPRKSNRSSNLLLALAGVVAVAGIAFAGGRLTAPAAPATGNGNLTGFPNGSFNPGQFPGGGQGVPGGGLGQTLGGGGLRGEVTAVSDTAITIQLESGQTVTVPVDASTDYQAASESTASDVVVGSNVVVQSEVSLNPGASPGASFDPSTGQPNVSFGPAQQVIIFGN